MNSQNHAPSEVSNRSHLDDNDTDLARRLVNSTYQLDLSQLESISEACLKELAKHEGELDLGGLHELTEAGAQILGDSQCERLFLGGLTSLPQSAVEKLSPFRGIGLSLGCTTLPRTALALLVENFSGSFLSLNLDSLSDKDFELLERRRKRVFLYGICRRLEALEELDDSPETMRLLRDASVHRGEVDLTRIINLSMPAAEALARFRCLKLRLDGLTSLSRKTASALTPFSGVEISLGALRALLPDTASELALFSCDLSLNGLEELAPAEAGILSRFTNTLQMNGLKTISEETARALEGAACEIHMQGLCELSTTASQTLAANKAVWSHAGL